MTERYPFAVDTSVWSQDNIDNVHGTLTESINEGYVTAEDDSPTRYLSVLDASSEISLENLSITLANPKLEVEESMENFASEGDAEEGLPGEEGVETETEAQVVVFTVEGSDELYGIQVAQDEEGNLQKYQFQFRKNEHGQLEAIPETIQLLPMDDEQEEVVEEQGDDLGEANENDVFLQEENSGEHFFPDNVVEEAQEETDLIYGSEQIEEEQVDIKPAILSVNVKQELQEQPAEYEEPPPTFTESLPAQEQINYEDHIQENMIEYNNFEESTLQPEENSASSESQNMEFGEVSEPPAQQPVDDEAFEHVEVRPDLELPSPNEEENEENEDANNENGNDSDENEYQIVEGLHITGDVEANETVEKENSVNNTNILKNKDVQCKNKKDGRMDNRLYLYVVQQHPEKENVDSLSLEMSNLCRPKVNPRSILKSSHAMLQTQNEIDNEQDERLNKRFARCKEAMQARNFHNFINKTTIPQAPVRQIRLPRKQKIKPVERMDEEIVVQEVMVSSTGFVETVGGINKENLAVTEYVELTDSDDDYDPKKFNRRKKKYRKKKVSEITISDSDTSSVIELNETDDEEPPIIPEQPETPPKRRRGRPPKNKPDESPAKKSRVEANDNPTKPEIPCPKCDKTFPSQNSLKTHLQHHNLQNTLKALPDKYKCNDCTISFKNSVLLKNHKCTKKFPCNICKKRFPDTSSLNGHKRIHAKEQLIKSTAIAQVSPKKIKPAVPTQRVSPKKKLPVPTHFKLPSPPKATKCKTCGKLCSSVTNLNIHMKSHKEYICGTCSASFVSQLLLERHILESCVKTVRRSLRAHSVSSVEKTSPSPTKVPQSCVKAKCDKCTSVFMSYKALFKHKVVKHNLETPDKSVLEKTGKSRVQGGAGVPAARRLQMAFEELKRELEGVE